MDSTAIIERINEDVRGLDWEETRNPHEARVVAIWDSARVNADDSAPLDADEHAAIWIDSARTLIACGEGELSVVDFASEWFSARGITA